MLAALRSSLARRFLSCSTRTVMDDVRTAKAALRKLAQEKISSLPDHEVQRQSKRVLEKLLSMREYQEAKSLCVYLSMRDEIQTLDILRHAFSVGKKCYVPRYYSRSGCPAMDMVLLRDMDDYDSLPMTKWNIKQPSRGDVRPEMIDEGGADLVLVPGLAFTKDGKRLGRGKGYYDAYLGRAQEANALHKTVALCFAEQLLPDVPMTASDKRIDLVLHGDAVE